MNEIETIWRVLVTSLAIWRLSQVLFWDTGRSRSSEDLQDERSVGRFWVGRAADFVCWISVWMSSQTALWVVCGFAGVFFSWVFFSWLSMAAVSRLVLRGSGDSERSAVDLLSVAAAGESSPCLSCGDMLEARHG